MLIAGGHTAVVHTVLPVCTTAVPPTAVQGYLAHKKQRAPLGPYRGPMPGVFGAS